jgi:hypothetical protein
VDSRAAVSERSACSAANRSLSRSVSSAGSWTECRRGRGRKQIAFTMRFPRLCVRRRPRKGVNSGVGAGTGSQGGVVGWVGL